MKVATGFDERRERAEAAIGWGGALLSAAGILIMCAALAGAIYFFVLVVKLLFI